MKGQGGGGTAKGGGKNRAGGGTVAVKKTKALKTTKALDESILKLRAALMTDSGKDKDVTQGIAPAFFSYALPRPAGIVESDAPSRVLQITFSPKLNKTECSWAFDLVKEHMEDVYDIAGYGWDDDDKESELKEQGSRFLIVRDPSMPNQPVAFVHFRFTVQGEALDQMAGDTCVYVFDLHVEEEYQRKGLGKHLMVILELIGKSHFFNLICLHNPLLTRYDVLLCIYSTKRTNVKNFISCIFER